MHASAKSSSRILSAKIIFHDLLHCINTGKAGSERGDEKKEGGWKERMDDWKLQQGNLGPDPDDINDPDMAMYVSTDRQKAAND